MDDITVEIAYSPQPWEIGQITSLPADQAKAMIREGRARRYYPPAPDSPPTTDTTPAPSRTRRTRQP